MRVTVGTSESAQFLDQGPGPARRVSWGAIFGGAFVALGIWALLYALGLALGLSSVDAREGVGGPALFTGIWSVLTPLLALFAGGWVAARLAGWFDKTAGALHGAVMWGLTTVLGGFLLATLMTSLVGATVQAGQTVVSGAAGANVGQIQQQLGISTQEMLAPINQRLQAQGHPPITADGLNAAIQAAISQSLRQGRLDQEIFERALAQNTNLSRQDVNELFGQVTQGMGAIGTELRQTAASVASGAARAFWGVFFALLLGLVSSVLGALLGVNTLQRHERKSGVRFNQVAEAP